MKKLVVCVLLSVPALAAAESPWRLGVAVGYGERSNPLVFADDVPIYVDLDIAWFGEHWFFDNGDLGLTFVNNDRVTASAVVRYNSDRVFFSLTNTRFVTTALDGSALATATPVVIPDRDAAIEAGFELLTDGRWGYLQASAYHDVSGTHDGYEVGVIWGTGLRAGDRWYLAPELGVTYKSEALNDYYWGIRADESNAALPAYNVEDGVNVRARLRASYYLSKNWSLSLTAEYERINDSAAASPIVDGQGVFGYFAGVAYRF
ncbi:MAG: MipA/OmpV family protein [Woeseiaceae bacterium]|nr:MipA/OmpV family protein [Woeseiaceae bacterium]